MTTIEQLRARIGQEFDGECRLTADEARAWRDGCDGALWIRDQAADRLIDAVDAARKAP